jgi:F0F1-type ATP synthase delta subunit
MISSKQITVSVYKIIKEQKTSDEHVVDALIEYLTENKLLNLLPQVVNHLERLEKQDSEHNTLNIETATEVDADILAKIHKKFGAPEKINQNKNAELIGGFVATYRGFVFDASIKNQLKLLRNKLIAK